MQLGQKQQELDRLQRQNDVLKEQLGDALGKEQSARDGYVLQVHRSPRTLQDLISTTCTKISFQHAFQFF